MRGGKPAGWRCRLIFQNQTYWQMLLGVRAALITVHAVGPGWGKGVRPELDQSLEAEANPKHRKGRAFGWCQNN